MKIIAGYKCAYANQLTHFSSSKTILRHFNARKTYNDKNSAAKELFWDNFVLSAQEPVYDIFFISCAENLVYGIFSALRNLFTTL